MFNIIDFNRGIGGLSVGMERYGSFITLVNPLLNTDNEYVYNKTHLNPFWAEAVTPNDFFGTIDVDVALFQPKNLKIQKRGSTNFSFDEIETNLRWVRNYRPSFVVFSFRPEVLPFLHYQPSDDSNFDDFKLADNWLLFDSVVYRLNRLGYNVQIYVLNYLDFNIPQDTTRLFYVAWKMEGRFDLKKPVINNTRMVKDILKDIPNDSLHKPKWKHRDICSKIKPGYCANDYNLHTKVGYVRLKGDSTASALYNDFYKVMSASPSIHPTEDRPLTLREGCRLFGLDDTFVFPDKFSNPVVADMIYNSISPRIGYYFADAIIKLLM